MCTKLCSSLCFYLSVATPTTLRPPCPPSTSTIPDHTLSHTHCITYSKNIAQHKMQNVGLCRGKVDGPPEAKVEGKEEGRRRGEGGRGNR